MPHSRRGSPEHHRSGIQYCCTLCLTLMFLAFLQKSLTASLEMAPPSPVRTVLRICCTRPSTAVTSASALARYTFCNDTYELRANRSQARVQEQRQYSQEQSRTAKYSQPRYSAFARYTFCNDTYELCGKDRGPGYRSRGSTVQ